MGALHDQGRDKVTILASKEIEAYSLWAEQFIAESTGKEGKGIIPIGDEPIGEPAVYSDDRLFVALRIGDDAEFDNSLRSLKAAGHPVIRFDLVDKYDLAAEFFRWEFATAVAGAHLGIDPFDEPNVQESKDNTKAVLLQYEQSGSLPDESAAVTDGALRVYGDVSGNSASGALVAASRTANPGDYVALMAYVTPDETTRSAAAPACRDSRFAQDRHHARIRSPLPAQHRPVAQGRAEHRRVHTGHGRRGTESPSQARRTRSRPQARAGRR